MSAETEVDFERERKTLRLLIDKTDGGVLAFGLYTGRNAVDGVVEWLQQGSVPLRTVVLSQDLADPTVVVGALPRSPRQCVVFYNVETAFPKFLGFVNFHREELLEAGHALLFWVREEGLRRIAEEAPDFWAWRSRVFDFRTVEESEQWTTGPHDSAIAHYSSSDLEEQVASLADSGSTDLVSQLALGRRQIALERYDEADQSLQLAVEDAERSHDSRRLAEALLLLGNSKLARKKLGEAERLYIRSSELAERINAGDLKLGAEFALIQLRLMQGDGRSAQDLIKNVLEWARKTEDSTALAVAFDLFGDSLAATEDLRGAEQAYLQSMKYAEIVGWASATASTLARLGRVYLEMGDLAKAQEALQRAASLFQSNGFTKEAAEVTRMLQELNVS